MPTQLTPFEQQLRQWLEADSHRPKKDRRTAMVLFSSLRAVGFDGSYAMVNRFTVAGSKPVLLCQGLCAFGVRMGEAFQFDWSTEQFPIGGVERRLQVAHTKLCASRAFCCGLSARVRRWSSTPTPGPFGRLAGAQAGIYDNMKTAVDKVCKGKGRVVNSRFSVMTAHYLFDPEFCNVAAAGRRAW